MFPRERGRRRVSPSIEKDLNTEIGRNGQRGGERQDVDNGDQPRLSRNLARSGQTPLVVEEIPVLPIRTDLHSAILPHRAAIEGFDAKRPGARFPRLPGKAPQRGNGWCPRWTLE